MISKTFAFAHRKAYARSALVFFVCALFATFLLVVPYADAQVTDTQNLGLDSSFQNVAVESDRDIKGIIASIVNISLGFLGIIAVIIIGYAGYLWTTAAGNEDQVTRAKALIRNALIGLAIIFSAWGIVTFVLSRLSDATSGTPIGGGGDNGGTIPGTLPADRMKLLEFQTSHAGSANAADVYLCSTVQTRFNHWLNTAGVVSALNRGENPLQVLRTKKDTNINGGTTVTENITFDLDAVLNIIRFGLDPSSAEPSIIDTWHPYSEYEVRVPKTITDQDDRAVSDCSAIGCRDMGTYYAWTFNTTDKTDSERPFISRSYPAIGEFEDRQVPRSATLSISFSESVDVLSIVDETGLLRGSSVRIERIQYAPGSNLANSEVLETIPSSHFDVSVSPDGLYMALNSAHKAAFDNGPYFEPYAWYRITVNNITDLCNNALDGQTQWVFQTNGQTPGVSFLYPRDTADKVCSDTETFVKFRTSMFDVQTSECAVSPNGGGFVRGGSGFTNRSLSVYDSIPALSEGVVAPNPNAYCKRYDFAPPTQLLAPNTYSPAVRYADFKNKDQSITTNWSFAVVGSGCVHEPYISRISPGEGPWGRCVTVVGRHFNRADGTYNPTADKLFSRLDADASINNFSNSGDADARRDHWEDANGNMVGVAHATPPQNWNDTYITTDILNFEQSADHAAYLPRIPGSTDVQGVIELGLFVERHDDIAGALRSNQATYAVYTDQPEYQGPCLYSINPTHGATGERVTLTGKNLFTTGGSAPGVVFTSERSAPLIQAVPGIPFIASVPGQSIDGDVVVRTDRGESNGIFFDIDGAIGAACSEATNACVPNSASCNQGLVCSTQSCTCQQPDTFRITREFPARSCSEACTNALIGFETSKPIGSVANAVALLECTTQACAPSEAAANKPITVSVDGTRAEITPTNGALRSNTFYRVIVRGGTTGVRSSANFALQPEILNYAEGADGVLTAYSWVFKTGALVCSVSRLSVSPESSRLYETQSSVFYARAFSAADSCSPAGQEIAIGTGLEWASAERTEDGSADECFNASQEPLALITPDSAQSRATVAIGAFPANDRVSRNAWVCARYSGIKNGSALTLSPKCVTNEDCQITNGFGACNSTCVNGFCTPKINYLSPTNGAISTADTSGTWITIGGCYFGNARGSVTIDGKAAGVPNALLCGNTWTDTQIIAEANAQGPIAITPANSADTVTWDTPFTANNTAYPAICKAYPESARINAPINIFGNNFGSGEAFGDNANARFGVTFAKDDQSVIVTTISNSGSCARGQWSNDAVCVHVSPSAPVGLGTISVKNNNTQSAGYTFRVIGGSTEGGILRITGYQPANTNTFPACLNVLFELTLTEPIDSATLGAPIDTVVSAADMQRSAFSVHGKSGRIAGTITITEFSGITKLRFYPNDPLEPSTKYLIELLGGESGIRGANGQLLSVEQSPDCDWKLGTNVCIIPVNTIANGNEPLCAVSGLSVQPSNSVYTCAGKDNCPGDTAPLAGHQRLYEALGKNGYGQSVVDATGPIQWSVAKAHPQKDPIVAQLTAPSATNATSTVTLLPNNGVNVITANAANSTLTGSANIRVFLCENPWPSSMLQTGMPFNDKTGDTSFTEEDIRTNFSLFYCRDAGEPGIAGDLPALTLRKEVGLDQLGAIPGLVKELFFTSPVTRGTVASFDAIGIRVLGNEFHVPIREWYDSQTFQKGSPQAITLGGYSALQDGRTLYVHAPNDTQGSAPSVYSNIYLLSVSDNPSPETVSIFSQLLSTWDFAINLDAADQNKIRRDITRIQDSRTIARALETRQSALVTGSFQPGLSLSVWPSWSGALSQDIGKALPVDPINKIICASKQGIDQNTCWDKTITSTPQYVCDSNSHFYVYSFENNSASFLFGLEYGSFQNWKGLGSDIPGLTGAYMQDIGNKPCVNVRYTQ